MSNALKRARQEPAPAPAAPPQQNVNVQESFYPVQVQQTFDLPLWKQENSERGVWRGNFNNLIFDRKEDILGAKHVLLTERVAYLSKAAYADWRKTFSEEFGAADLIFIAFNTAKNAEPFVVGTMSFADEKKASVSKVYTRANALGNPRSVQADMHVNLITEQYATGQLAQLDDLDTQGVDYLFWFGEAIRDATTNISVPLLRSLEEQDNNSYLMQTQTEERRRERLVQFLNQAVFAHAYARYDALIYERIYELPLQLDVQNMQVNLASVFDTQTRSFVPAQRGNALNAALCGAIERNAALQGFDQPLTALGFYILYEKQKDVADVVYSPNKLASYFILKEKLDEGEQLPAYNVITAKLTLAPAANNTGLKIMDWQSDMFFTAEDFLYALARLSYTILKDAGEQEQTKLNNLLVSVRQPKLPMWFNIGFREVMPDYGVAYSVLTDIYTLQHTQLYTWIQENTDNLIQNRVQPELRLPRDIGNKIKFG